MRLRLVQDRYINFDKDVPPVRIIVADGEEDVTIKELKKEKLKNVVANKRTARKKLNKSCRMSCRGRMKKQSNGLRRLKRRQKMNLLQLL
uniref:Uncharacterized protein n=1 Tax=Zea mays TaxID=4577 RepID=A0A804M092_MAIZE